MKKNTNAVAVVLWVVMLMFFVLGAGLLLCVTQGRAQDRSLTLEEGLAEAILDMTTTPRRHLRWNPCGERLNRQGRAAYAKDIATSLVRHAGDDLDPWMMSAQLMQESGMNPCVFSNREFRELRRRLGRSPTRREMLRLLRSPRLRREYGIRAMDAGLAQFRWPGVMARRLGIASPEQLLDVETSVEAFASALRIYRTACDTRDYFSGTDTTRSGRVIRWRYACNDVYWAIHNTGDLNRIRRQYVVNVRNRYRRGPEEWRRRYEEQRQTRNDS